MKTNLVETKIYIQLLKEAKDKGTRDNLLFLILEKLRDAKKSNCRVDDFIGK